MATYHVTLDGQGYLIDLDTYKRVAEELAPTNLKTQHYTQQSWAGGVDDSGIWEPSHPDRYTLAVGLEAYRGPLKPGRSLTSRYQPGLSVTEFGGLIVYKDVLYAWNRSTGHVYSSVDGVTWTNPYNAGEPLACAALFNEWLILGALGSGKLFKFDGSTWALWTTLAGVGTTALAPWERGGSEYLYVGARSSTGACSLVEVSSAATATAKQFNGVETEITCILGLGPKLWYATLLGTNTFSGRLFAYDGTDVEVQAVLQDNAITCLCPWRDELLAGSRTRGKVWRVQQEGAILGLGGLAEIFRVPDVTGIGGVSTYSLRMWSIVVDNDRIHVPVVDAQGLGTYVSEDGQHWHLPNTGGLGQEPRGAATFKGLVYLTTKSNAGARVIEVSSAYTTSATLVTPWFDHDALPISKTFLTLTLFHSALAAGESLTVEYALDGSATWTSLGVSDVDGATSKAFPFPAATTASRIRFRILFALAATSAAPQLEQMDLEWSQAEASVTRKTTWEFEALLEGTAELPLILADHSPSPLTGAQLSDVAWTTKARTTTVPFQDLDGSTYTVWVDALRETVSKRSQREGLSTRARFTLREA